MAAGGLSVHGVRGGALFVGWALAGAGLVLAGISGLWVFALFPAVAVILFLSTWEGAGPAAWGLLAGAGVLCVLIAYINREGPGMKCTSTAGSYGCGTYPDPRPWLAVGLVLIAAGILATIVAHRR